MSSWCSRRLSNIQCIWGNPSVWYIEMSYCPLKQPFDLRAGGTLPTSATDTGMNHLRPAMAIRKSPFVVYSTSGSTTPRIKSGIDETTLFANGCLVDIILKMPSHIGESRCRSCNRRMMSLDEWMRVVCNTNLGTCDSWKILEALQRSVVWNRALTWTSKGTIVGRLPDAWINILEDMNCFTNSCGCDVKGMINKEVGPVLGCMNIVLGDGRTFAVTERSLGFIPRTAQEGDIFCILLGCSVPVIFWPSTVSSAFHFFGESYIHGLMEGQFMQVVSERTLEPDEIDILYKSTNPNNKMNVSLRFSLLDTKLSSVAVVSGSLDSLSYSNFQSSLILNHTVPLEWLRDWGVWSTGSVAKIPNGPHTVRWPWCCVDKPRLRREWATTALIQGTFWPDVQTRGKRQVSRITFLLSPSNSRQLSPIWIILFQQPA